MSADEDVSFIYLCPECEKEVATTSTTTGAFEAPPSLYCGCTGELVEMDPKAIDESVSLSVEFAAGETA